ncbi:MAG TPA: NAD(P)-dependent oxidoreductase [Leucothrix sp.]|nr:NAD(P)-dependent oxidoreductase [Leucothrix sp.]
MQQQKITFIGLGAMGYPMAGHLANKGYTVTVYNRTTAIAEKWVEEYSGEKEETIEDAVKQSDVILTCVGNDNDVWGVYQKIFNAAKQGAILIDHTTTSAKLARQLDEKAKAHNMAFIDAPVSGGQAGAEQGILTVMAGGDQEVFDQVLPIIDTYAKAATLIGSAGQGQVLKMINQVCFIGVLQGLSEALTLAQAAGIDGKTIVDVLQHGAAGSWQMVNRTETMMNNEFDFGFAVDWVRKDLSICLEEAEKLGVDLPMTKQIDDKYKQLQERGYARADTSVLIKQFDNEVRNKP